MANSYTNKRGQEYFLHGKTIENVKKGTQWTLYFFSKKPEDAIEIPEKYCIVENEKTGLPFLKKKVVPADAGPETSKPEGT